MIMSPAHPFDELVRRPETDIRLAEAALLLALDAYPALDVGAYLGRFRSLADRVTAASATDSPKDRIEAMRVVLVEEEELRGNADKYYDPRNSYLNEVLDRKLGIPISLSVVWLDVARQLDWPMVGVGLPGHFIIGYTGADDEVLVDPFNGGCIVSRNDCAEIVTKLYGEPVLLTAEHFRPAGTKEILSRMLRNLFNIHTRGEAWSRAFDVVSRMLALHPDSEDIQSMRGRIVRELARLN